MAVLDLTNVSSSNEHKETCIVFDWDDTLCPSTFMSKHEKTPDIEHQLSQLERSVSHVLALALEHGKVFIITNAQEGWVPLSIHTYMPTLRHWIDKITVISARSRYEPIFPNHPVAWKVQAFMDHIDSPKQILSFGDSFVERIALLETSKRKNIACHKNIKFIELPTIQEILNQWNSLLPVFAHLVKQNTNIDIILTKN